MKKLFAFLLSLCIILSYQAGSVFAEDKITFTDVDAASSLGKDVSKLVSAGIVNGMGDGTFAPSSPVTRAQICKMVNLIWKYTKLSETGFTDVTVDKWYYAHVLAAKEAGYINGMGDGTFCGDSNVTREQMCAIISRVAELYDLGITTTVSDAVSPWAVSYVNIVLGNKLMNTETGDKFRATENMTRGEVATLLAKFVADSSDNSSDVNNGGGSTGGSTGGNTSGGSTGIKPNGGGSGSGSSGGNDGEKDESGNTPSEPDKELTREEIIEKNAEMLTYLKDIKSDLDKASFRGNNAKIVNIVKECLADAIKVGEAGDAVITRDYVYTEYDAKIQEAKDIYYSMPEESQAAFIDRVTQQVSSETIDYLTEIFL